MKNGVPWDVAFNGQRPGMDADLSQATAIMLSEMEGCKFDWNAWEFKKD